MRRLSPSVLSGLSGLTLCLSCADAVLKPTPTESSAPSETGETAVMEETWYADRDGDGYGDGADPGVVAAEAPAGTVANAEDCDDTRVGVHPGAEETCDGADQDCDGIVDEEAVDAVTWYPDEDRDGFGDPVRPTEGCEVPTGGTDDASDCDDTNAGVHPGAGETCDGVDEDCDGEADEDASDAFACLPDRDEDGYGDALAPTTCCALGEGWVEMDKIDCDDENRTISPVGVEICNLLDDDCDREADEAMEGTEDTLCDLWGVHVTSDADLRYVGYEGDTLGRRGTIVHADVDSDGYADLWLGGETSSIGGSRSGVVYLLHGPLPVSGYIYEFADATLIGPTEQYRAGESVEVAGDLDGDGYSEVWVGASTDTSTPGTGSVHLILGPTTGTMMLDDSDLTWYPDDTSDPLFYHDLGAGDYDGDGVPDLVIGSSSSEIDRGYVGEAWITRIDDTWGLRPLSDAAVDLQAEYEYDRLGMAATMMGSTTGDGVDDVLITAWLVESAESCGVVWVLEEAPADGTYVLADLADAGIYGEAADDLAGREVADLGDLNDDGYTDFAVSASGEDTLAPYAGAIYVIYGPTGTRSSLTDADAKFVGVEEEASLVIVSGDGDVDGDGHLDLALGAYENGLGDLSGTAFLVRGPLDGGTSAVTDADALFEGEQEDSWTGYGLSISGDTNKDGYDEVIVSAPLLEDVPNADNGAVYVYYGQPF